MNYNYMRERGRGRELLLVKLRVWGWSRESHILSFSLPLATFFFQHTCVWLRVVFSKRIRITLREARSISCRVWVWWSPPRCFFLSLGNPLLLLFDRDLDAASFFGKQNRLLLWTQIAVNIKQTQKKNSNTGLNTFQHWSKIMSFRSSSVSNLGRVWWILV